MLTTAYCIQIAFVPLKRIDHISDLAASICIKVILMFQEMEAHEHVQGHISAWIVHVELIKFIQHGQDTRPPFRCDFRLSQPSHEAIRLMD